MAVDKKEPEKEFSVGKECIRFKRLEKRADRCLPRLRQGDPEITDDGNGPLPGGCSPA